MPVTARERSSWPILSKYVAALSPPKARSAAGTNIGVRNDSLLNDRICVTYELSGEKYKMEYHIGLAADKCELKKHSVFDEEKGKYVRIK